MTMSRVATSILTIIVATVPCTLSGQSLSRRVTALEVRVTQLESALTGARTRIDALERGLASSTAANASLSIRLTAAETQITELRQNIFMVDQGNGLMRSFLERYTFSTNALTPTPRQFTDRGPAAAVIIPISAGVPGNPPFTIVNGAAPVRYGDCLTFSMHGRLIVEPINVATCASTQFDVLYMFSGPPFMP